MTDLIVRPMQPEDIPALLDFFNHTVRLGGTTAHEDEMTEAEFRAHYFDDPDIAYTALAGDRPVGFQALFQREPGLYSIGSFTDQRNPVRGAGAALFAATREAAKEAGGHTILAEIRADNVPGLAYYSKMGLTDTDLIPAVPLKDGTPMDRVIKTLPLT